MQIFFKVLGVTICYCLFTISFSFAYAYQESNSADSYHTILSDSIENNLVELQTLFEAGSIDSAYALANHIILSARDQGLIDAERQANYQLARIFNRQNEFEKSDSLLQHLLVKKDEADFTFDLLLLMYNNAMRRGDFSDAKLILSQARVHVKDSSGVNMVRYRYSMADYLNNGESGQKKKVLDLLLLAKKEAPDNIDYEILFNINYQLGSLYAAIAVYDQALLVAEENEKIAIQHKNYYLQLFGIFNQLSCYSELKNHKKIYEVVQRAMRIKEEHNVSTAFDYLYLLQGKSYLQQNQLDSAFHYFNLGEILGLERNSKQDLSNNLLGKSEVYFKQGDYNRAKEYADKARAVNPKDIDGLNEMYWRLEAVEGKYQKAYEGAIKSLKEINGENEVDESYEIISKLLNDKFSAEKELQQQEILDRERKNKLFLFYGLMASIVLLLIGAAFIQSRNSKKLEKLNNSLLKRNEALTHFSYISSHDLKEPVRNIVSFSELLENKLKASASNSKELEFASIIKNSSNTLLEIVKSLKIFSETAFDEDVLLDDFNVEDVFNDLSRNMQQLIKTKNAEVNFVNRQNIGLITFSKPMLYLLLQNLIQNALKYNNNQKPIVEIDLSIHRDTYLFKIGDNGNGIDSDKLEYIFKPFKTLQNKSLTQSSGLGLSICKNILDKYKGKIWVESELGVGSNFYFSIPKNLKDA